MSAASYTELVIIHHELQGIGIVLTVINLGVWLLAGLTIARRGRK